MSIRKIGSTVGGAPVVPPSDVPPVGDGFDVEAGQESARGQAIAAPQSDLQALRSGEITPDQYVERKVDAAVRHLPVSSEERALIAETLRAQVATDPILGPLLEATVRGRPEP